MARLMIRTENLGKSYVLFHSNTSERYRALRDVLTGAGRAFWGWRRSQGRSRPEHSEQFWALRDVTFEVQQGDVVGIIGRNGAGKSTLLKVLSQITEPSSGRVTLHGRVASLLEVGTGFHAELTGRENIYLNGTILGMRRWEISRKFDEIVEFAGVDRFLDTPVKRYSSGMYVRLAFAVAAHLEPEILIVDEVLAVGDAQFQKKCLGKMSDVARSGRTVLFVSHNMAAIQTLCQKAVRLQAGRLVGYGDVDSQIQSYKEELDAPCLFAGEARPLSHELDLCSISCIPRVIESGQSVKFSVALRAKSTMRLEWISFLVYSESEARVSNIDLRSSDGPYRLVAGTVLNIQAAVDRFNLVEGCYHLGITAGSGETVIDALYLIQFEVLHRKSSDTVIPYHPRHCGFVDFSTRILDVTVADRPISI